MASLYAGVASPRYLPPPFLSVKATKRTNRLREKLRKTLKMPLRPSPTSLPHNPITTREEREVLQRPVLSREESERETDEVPTISSPEKRLESSILQASRPIDDVHGALHALPSRSFFSLALQFLGFFMFQTVCVVWFLAPVDEKAGEDDAGYQSNVGNSGMGMGKTKENDSSEPKPGLRSGHIGGIEDGELQERISMIRAMARDARLMEMGGHNDGDSVAASGNLQKDSAEPSMDSNGRRIENSPIKGEIEELLRELPRLVPSHQKKMPPMAKFVGRIRRNSRANEMIGERNHLRSLQKDDLAKPGAENQVRRSSGLVRDTPRGFQKKGVVGKEKTKANIDIGGTSKHGRNKHAEVKNSSLRGHEGQVTEVKLESSLEPAIIPSETEESNASGVSFQGAVGRSGSGSHTSLGGSLRSYDFEGSIRDHPTEVDGATGKADASKLSAVTPPSSELSQETEVKLKSEMSRSSMKVTRPSNSRASSISKHNEMLQSEGAKSQLHGIEENKPKEKDFWWRSIPYVHVIFLHRGVGDKRATGLYSLKMHHGIDTDASPHVIAFEDHRDATNFCSLLESFFQRLGDAYAKVVPLSIKEVLKEVKSGAMRVKVMKKGKLHLYIGQPLEEAEKQLHSF